ncbi:integrase [Aureimonas sp. ME7]|uniref:integrase n=1 Tax=Aureimonas sp. ME7 TaxID=2744252 RepID=UPI0015F73BD6|nr:integrase [Aureimonas sp. ME7]
MPRPTLPARLEWEPPRYNAKTGQLTHNGNWVITDRGKRRRTGCGKEDLAGAQAKLADYLAEQHQEAEPEPNLAASQILVADVVAYYAKEAVVDVARPKEFLARQERLLAWWGSRKLSAVNGFTCKAYARARGSQSAARRELEDFRAAIRLYAENGLLRENVVVVLPSKHRSRLTYFDRGQMATLLWYCWRAREVQKGVVTDKRHRRHLVPFILTALYTGSRSAKIWNASFTVQEDGPWVDLEHGVYHRLGTKEVEQSNKRAGTVRIPGRLLAHMRRWRRGSLKDGRRVQREWLVEYRGQPADPRKALSKAMDHVFGEGHPYVRHTFRHTCASWLLWAGEDLNEVAGYMSMTVDVLISTYGHDHPEANMAVGKAFTEGRAGHRRGRSRRERGAESAVA